MLSDSGEGDQHLFDDEDYLLATTTIPMFKLAWTSDQGLRSRCSQLLKDAEKIVSNPDVNITSEAPVVERKSSFFELEDEPSQEQDQVVQYLNSSETSLAMLSAFPTIKLLYRKYNCTLPSSAQVERLFSHGSLVYGQKRYSLVDSNFEKHLLLHVNESFLKKA